MFPHAYLERAGAPIHAPLLIVQHRFHALLHTQSIVRIPELCPKKGSIADQLYEDLATGSVACKTRLEMNLDSSKRGAWEPQDRKAEKEIQVCKASSTVK